jgi:hypothetical protein
MVAGPGAGSLRTSVPARRSAWAVQPNFVTPMIEQMTSAARAI